MKSHGLTVSVRAIRADWSTAGETGIPGVAVNAQISGGTPVAKAGLWAVTDAEERKRGERTGLDTLVVHAVNGGY